MAEEKKENESSNPITDAWSKNWLVPVVLLMLRQWSSYGYELMEKLAEFGMRVMNAGSFYRTLRQMEKDGLVNSTWDTSEAGPAKRRYSITEAGENYLKFWTQSLDHYQKMMNSFLRLYTNPFSKTDKPEKTEE